MDEATKNIELLRFEKGTILPVNDLVSVEEPLEIRVTTGSNSSRSTAPISVTMRTPGHDDELAAGFLLTEGIIHDRKDVIDISRLSENIIDVILDCSLKIETRTLARNFYTTSSCGVCGKASIDAIPVPSEPIATELLVNSAVLENLSTLLFKSQGNFQLTGGIHASALFDGSGSLLVLREDVGRHNALDKLIGNHFLKTGEYFQDSILLVSGRASFELIQKAAVAGIPVVAAIGAPSSLAVELADQKGITLVGFLKSDRFNIYTHKDRIDINE